VCAWLGCFCSHLVLVLGFDKHHGHGRGGHDGYERHVSFNLFVGFGPLICGAREGLIHLSMPALGFSSCIGHGHNVGDSEGCEC
jgi:hypothetical protein